MRIYGPYVRKDGRQIILKYFDDGRRTTQSYPRYIWEQHYKCELQISYDVHHIDGDPFNNDIDNLSLVLHSLHAEEHAQYPKNAFVMCIWCKLTFTMTRKQLSTRRRDCTKGKQGPFCSRRCSGKYGKQRQIEKT